MTVKRTKSVRPRYDFDDRTDLTSSRVWPVEETKRAGNAVVHVTTRSVEPVDVGPSIANHAPVVRSHVGSVMLAAAVQSPVQSICRYEPSSEPSDDAEPEYHDPPVTVYAVGAYAVSTGARAGQIAFARGPLPRTRDRPACF